MSTYAVNGPPARSAPPRGQARRACAAKKRSLLLARWLLCWMAFGGVAPRSSLCAPPPRARAFYAHNPRRTLATCPLVTRRSPPRAAPGAPKRLALKRARVCQPVCLNGRSPPRAAPKPQPRSPRARTPSPTYPLLTLKISVDLRSLLDSATMGRFSATKKLYAERARCGARRRTRAWRRDAQTRSAAGGRWRGQQCPWGEELRRGRPAAARRTA